MKMDDLRTQLDEAGRRPVPAPRPEFVEDLLARIQLEQRVAAPTPIPLASRRHAGVGRRLAAVATAAAAVLVAVGGFLTMRTDTEPTQDVRPTVAIADRDDVLRFVEDPSDGIARATCDSDGLVRTQTNELRCKAGQVVEVTIENGEAVSAVPVLDDEVNASEDTAAAVQAPLEVAATTLADGQGVSLTWAAADGAVRYEVLRAAAIDGIEDPAASMASAIPLTSTAELSISDNLDGITVGTAAVRYRVLAIGTDGETVAQSAITKVELIW